MANDRQLELALRVKTYVKQAKTELHELQLEIKDVGASSEKAAIGNKAQADAINAQGKAARSTTQAINKQADSERKRIKDLIHGSKSVEESERSLAERQREASGAAQALTAAQRKASAARARAAALDRVSVKSQMADYAVLDKILAGNIKTRDELSAAEALLDRLQKRGAISTTELTAAFAALNKVTDKNTAANVTNAASRRGLNSRAYAEIGTAASEVAAGNFGRLRRTGAAFLNQSGFFRKLFTPTGVAVTGLAASVVGLALAYKHATDEVTDINRALIRSGNVTGITAGQIENLANGLDHVSHSTAVKTLTQLVASGRVSENQFHKVGQATVDLATLTDQSVKDATDQIVEMLKSPTKGAKAFDDATHSLTAAQLQEITTLENTGHRAEAASQLLDAVATATKNGAAEIRRSLPWYDKLFHSIGKDSSDFFSQVGNVLAGRNQYGFSAQDLKNPLNQKAALQAQAASQLADLKGAIANYKQAVASGSGIARNAYAGDVSLYRTQLKQTYAQLSKLENSSTFLNAKRAAAAKKYAHQVDQAGKDAEATLKSLGINTTKMMSYAQKLQTARQAIIDQFNAGLKLPPGVKLNTATYEPYGPGWDKIKKQLQGPQDRSSDKKAAALTKAAADANKQLRDTFIQLQAAQNPTAAAWARYNKVVDNANKAVADAKTKLDALVASGKLSRAEADRRMVANKGLAAGIESLARQTRQAAIDKLADADRKAWEKLKQSLRTPAEVAADSAIAKLKELKRLMDAGDSGMTQAQAEASRQKIIGAAFGQRPQRRVHTQGPGGDIVDMQSQEQTDFAAKMKLAQQTRDAILASDDATHADRLAAQRAYQSQSESLQRAHAQNQAAIEQQKSAFALSTAQQGFGALASALSQAYGAQSKQARAAFALQKAAAVASAVLSISQSIANSAKIGYPWNIISIAGAVAQGAALIANIKSAQPGYAEGGYTGAGDKHQVAGVVHAGEVVWSQADIARAGGVGMVEQWRRGLRGYADGGYVNPLSNAPSPADIGIATPRMPKLSLTEPSDNGNQRGQKLGVRIVNSVDPQFVTDNMDSPDGERVIMNTISKNKASLKHMVGG